MLTVNSLLNTHVDWMRSMALFTRIFEYFDIPAEIENAPDAVTPDKVEGNVTFEHVGLASQETYLFNGTIRQNLLYAKPDASDAEMETALRKANIWEYVSKQPEGLDALVGNRGLKLSGGEKQRISIARVLLKDPTIFIFDEATCVASMTAMALSRQ